MYIAIYNIILLFILISIICKKILYIKCYLSTKFSFKLK